jgi:menaquinone-specific isochorismate synthase
VTLRVTTRPLDDDRPLLELIPPGEALAFVQAGEGLVGWGEALRLRPGPGTDRIERADAALREVDAEVDDPVGLPGSGLVALGAFSFAASSADSALVVPRVVVGRREGRTFLTRIDPETSPPAPPAPDPATSRPPAAPRDRPRYAGSTVPDVRWLEAVAAAIGRIEAGELDKVVLARDHALWAREAFDPLELARRLTHRFPSCHTFVMDGLVGATPELLLSRRGSRVVSRVLAGTAGRDPDEAADAALGAALLESDKDRWEHRLAAESVERVLAPRCRELTHEPHPRLLRLDNVQHLATTFEGELADAASSLELVAALHPTAAVGGTPTEQALALIEELEGMDRGRYAGPVGWTDQHGDGEWGIALRCAELAGARARLFAGVGVVAASLPEDELEETRLKLLAMQAVLDADPV